MSLSFINMGKFRASGRHGIHGTRIIDSDEIIYVTHGELYMFEGDEHYRISEGEWLHLRRGIRHGGDMPYMPKLSFIWLHFEKDSDNDLDGLMPHGRLPNNSSVPEYFQALQQEQSRQDSDNEIKNLLLRLIIREMCRRNSLPCSGAVSPLILAAEQIIATQYHTGLTPSRLAAMLKCNATYLGRLFRHVRAITITEAVNRKRLAVAAALLKNGQYSVKETALLTGFNDMAYFHRKFKAMFGHAPRDFTRNLLEGHYNSEAAGEIQME